MSISYVVIYLCYYAGVITPYIYEWNIYSIAIAKVITI